MRLRYVLSLFLAFFFALSPNANLDACDGTLVPVCGRSIFLAKFAPTTVVLPASGSINVPVGILPFVTWNTSTATCAQPISATLTLTLTCTPVGGSPVVIGPQNFTVPTPTVPGPQFLGGPVNFVIPAGTLPPGVPAICTVAGSYTVNFSGGSQGNGPITATGDADVCLVEPPPNNPDVPRLSMEYIKLDSLNFQLCRRGDQAYFYFLIANNDPEHAVQLSLTSVGNQVAGLPDGISKDDAFGMDVFAISAIDPGTDTFPAAFAQNLSPGELLHGDPTTPSAQELSDNLALGPNEATIICIAMRSFGMCALGSCNERSVKVTGQFDDGSPALACASTAMLVWDTPGKNSLCEFEDMIKVSPTVDAVWTPAVFENFENTLHHAATHSPGNIAPNAPPAFSPFPGTLIRGQSFGTDYPSTSMDIVRITEPASRVNWQALFYASRVNFVPVFNNVTIIAQNPQDLGSENLTNTFPMIGIDGIQQALTMDIIIDVSVDTIEIFIQGELYHRGAIPDFPQNAPQGTFWDPQTCRQIIKTADFSAKSIFSDPRVLVNNVAKDSASSEPDSVNVFDQNGSPVPWTANVRGPGIVLPANAGQAVVWVEYDLNGLAFTPKTNLAFLEISCPDAINNPLKVPVAIRMPLPTAIGSYDFTLPKTTRLYPNFPNPFNPGTNIRFDLRRPGEASLRLYDINGRLVRTIVAQKLPAGTYTYAWDAKDNTSRSVASGVYFYVLNVKNLSTKNVVYTEKKKMLLVK